MKIVIVSDPHIGDYPYGKTDATTGLNTRLLDFLHNLDQTINFAIENKADLYIIVGDVYRLKHPNSKIRKQFAPRMERLVSSGIRVILLTGNHDMTTSAAGAHAMSEMEELSPLIDNFSVLSKPDIVRIDDTELYILPFINRGEHHLLTPQDFIAYQCNLISEFNEKTKESTAKFKLFFGHFGTDKSVIGNSFDLDMSTDENENKVSMSAFDEGDWTHIYLGHIHKQQMLSNIAKHVGSLGRVDFSEEKEKKGFYYFDDGKDKFVTVDDRKFRTFNLKLGDDFDEKMTAFMEKIQALDLTQSIVRVKADILQTHLPEINLNEIETYLKDHSWHSLGVAINIVTDETIKDDVETITSVDLPDEALKKHIEKHPSRFKGIEEEAFAAGVEILKTVKQN